MSTIFKTLLTATLGIVLSIKSNAQCVQISNLPDTIQICKNQLVQLNPTITSIGGPLLPTDTTWSPATGLSNPNIINPTATVGTTSTTYVLTVQALTSTNYVVNGDFSAGNTGFTTDYVLGGGGAWGPLSLEGTYGVYNNPFAGHTNFSNFFDHTLGTAAGSMMVVNGSATANTNVWCQNITVLPNSWYDFSAWAASAVNSNPAILQFSIDGNPLGTPLNLPLNTGQWTQFHITWFSGTSTNINICIVDQQINPSGNDFAIDDIEFRLMCETQDSVRIEVTNLTPSYTFDVKYGCEGDTVTFVANDGAGDIPNARHWDFGDGSTALGQTVTHVYTTQGIYDVKLTTSLNNCRDSSRQTVDTRHPLIAQFSVDDDSICLGTTSAFTNTSTTTTINGIQPTYFYDFGDGNTSTNPNPLHIYTAPGVYTVMLAVEDFVPCRDTFYKTIFVTQQPSIDFNVSSTTICEGQTIDFIGDNSQLNLQGTFWDFGDGANAFNTNPVAHAYDTNGVFNVTYTGRYNICGDTSITKTITVNPIPTIDIGTDSTFCPNSKALEITATTYDPNGKATWLWNTGATTQSIKIIHEGKVTATVSIDGCTATDSLTILKDCYLDIPNAFSPNGDGENDYFLPRQLLSRGVTKFQMSIYNRWGEKIYTTDKTDGRGWDGKYGGNDQGMGVYIYIINVTFKDGKKENYKGNVTLIR